MWPQSACLSTLGASTHSARETIDGATRLSAGRAAPSGRDFSAPVAPGRLAAALVVSGVEGGAGTVEGGGDEVAVDLVGDLDALVAEPAGHLGDRDALGQARWRRRSGAASAG